MSTQDRGGISQAEIEIAALEEKARQRRFYQTFLLVWLLVSVALLASFAWIVISGFKSFPREAQYWCLGIALASVVVSGVVLKVQKDALFDTESRLRQWRAARRFRGGPQAVGVDAARERYRAESWDYVEDARGRAARNRRIHSLSQAIIIVGSLLVTSLTSAMAIQTPTNWITVVLSLIVSASAGLGGFFKWRERSFNLQQTANSIEKEYFSLELRINDYGDDDDDEAMRQFAERVEAIKEEQRNRELQLEQSPERGGEAPGTQSSTAGPPAPTG